MTTVGIIGSGNIGGIVGRRAAEAGHDVTFSYSHDAATLDSLARDVGHGAKAGSPRDAAAAEIVVLSVPWGQIDDALLQAGPLDGRVLIDTTNAYGPDGVEALPEGQTTGSFNTRRAPGSKLVKAFNTYTTDFQTKAASRPGETAMFICGDDADAKRLVEGLCRAIGFEPVDLGGLADGAMMDAPRRDGAVYGEAYTPADAVKIAEAVRVDPAHAAELARQFKA